MSDPVTPTAPAQVPPVTPTASVTPPDAIPYARFKEINDEKKRLEDEVKAFKDAEKVRNDAALSDTQKQAQKLAELETAKNNAEAEAKQWREFQKAKRDEIKTKLGDKWKEGYATLDLVTLEALSTDILGVVPPPPKGHKPGQAPGEPTLEEQLAAAQKSGNVVQQVAIQRQITERNKQAA